MTKNNITDQVEIFYNADGSPKLAQIPYALWQEIQKLINEKNAPLNEPIANQLDETEKMRSMLREAFTEMRDIKAGLRTGKPVEVLLNDL